MKEPNKIKALTEKFWAAETTQEEEAILKELAVADDDGLGQVESTYFKWVNEQKQLQSQRPFQKPTVEEPKIRTLYRKSTWMWAVAASILLAVGVFLVYQPQFSAPAKKTLLTDTYDNPEEAWAATKEAIALVNSKLQKATKPMGQMQKLDNLNILQMN